MLAPRRLRHGGRRQRLEQLNRPIEVNAKVFGGEFDESPAVLIKLAQRLQVNHTTLALRKNRIVFAVFGKRLAVFFVLGQPVA